MRRLSISRLWPIGVFLLTSFWISALLFHGGAILATAEEGMPFYHPVSTAQMYSSFWWDRVAPGQAVSVSPLWAGYMWAAAILSIFFSSFVVQGLFFFLLFFAGMYGAYKLFLSYSDDKYVAFVGGIFYLFNFYVLSQVWFRALYNGMFLWAYLPYFLLFTSRFLRRGSGLLVLVLSTFVFLPAFSHPGHLIMLAVSAGIIFLTLVYLDWEKKGGYFKRLLAMAAVLLIAHIWWLYPEFKLLNETFSADRNTGSSSYLVLEGTSNSFHLTDILLLRERFYTGNWFGKWYEGFLPIFVEIAIFMTAIYGFVKSKKTWFWVMLSVLGGFALFVAKGTNPPFGVLFYKALFKVSFMGAIRNPYEKFGLLIVLGYSFFFAVGFTQIFYVLRSYKKKFLWGLIGIFVLLLYMWPYWTGKIYPEYAMVHVPAAYEHINDVLNADVSDSRVLVLPLPPEHSAVFKWGYRGVEPSRFMFDKPSVAVGVYQDKNYKEISDYLAKGEDISELLEKYNIGFVVLRGDLDTELSQSLGVEDLRQSLDNTKGLHFLTKAGDLELYSYDINNPGLFAVKGSPTEVHYQKISPTRYIAEIDALKDGDVLVFKESYNAHWIAKDKDGNILPHDIEYGYANSWKLGEGKNALTIEFAIWPWQ